MCGCSHRWQCLPLCVYKADLSRLLLSPASAVSSRCAHLFHGGSGGRFRRPAVLSYSLRPYNSLWRACPPSSPSRCVLPLSQVCTMHLRTLLPTLHFIAASPPPTPMPLPRASTQDTPAKTLVQVVPATRVDSDTQGSEGLSLSVYASMQIHNTTVLRAEINRLHSRWPHHHNNKQGLG